MAARSAGRHADRVEAAIASRWRGAIRPGRLLAAIVNLHRLDPADHKPPRRLTEKQNSRKLDGRSGQQLIRVAQSRLDGRLYRLAVGGVGCCVLPGPDRDGVPVDRRGAPAPATGRFRSLGLVDGLGVERELRGHQLGIGACLVEQRLLTIHRDQHFHARNTLAELHHRPRSYDHEGGQCRGRARRDTSLRCRADF